MTVIRPARDPDHHQIRELVSTAGLPDVDPSVQQSSFVVAEREDAVVGCGGVEYYEVAGLLRSVVVAEPARGTGIGRELVTNLETAAVDAGIDAVYVLTMDAEGFFVRLGYEAVDRETVPVGVAGSEQFAFQCPSTASCLFKPL